MSQFPQDWAMCEDDGNQAAAQMMRSIKASLEIMRLPKVRQLLHEKIEQVSGEFGEIYDTDVRHTIKYRLTKWVCEVHDLHPTFGLDESFWGI